MEGRELNKFFTPTGAYLGLTGKRIYNPADALLVGLGTHYVPSGNLGSLKDTLLATTLYDIAVVLSNHSTQPESEPPLNQIVEELKKHKDSFDATVAGWAKESLEGLGKGALASSYRSNDSNLSKLSEVMKLEYRIAVRSSLRDDFVEGVRAVLVDKDQNPKWSPSNALFEPLEPRVEELKI
ncbi:hypothetical protein RND81_08G058400 [Saponaria officinalis]|uniref:3-hydroxyisobutyryl-CoA hydrolase n=1 Tax=Saponaria officinalis TaxID=3572 RepID=A0AAW1J5J2_SAPOF